MGKHWYYCLFLIWFSYLIISSVLLFGKGFLLTKNALKINSTCLSFSDVPCLTKESSPVNNIQEQCSRDQKLGYVLQDVKSSSSVCLPQRAKIILMIIDALRYDFTVYDDGLKNPAPYENKLPVIKKLMDDNPESSRLFKFIADPPTTTMQRIKALTTGSLPTFIDAGSNFATNEINEDNIIDQLLSHNLSTVLIGDDTWDGLYPNRFLRKYPFPSFDVWDLDTVDTGVTKHLFPETKETDWSLLIAHYLGVDHCGHRYGPDHPEMTRKLTEMNAVIEQLVENLDSDTMLFVIGDHGMSETGNHGGDSEDELMAAMFVHSKKPLINYGNFTDTVRQVNIVPTMAAIFGVPIPFSNLGTIILELLPIMNSSYIEEWRYSLFYIWENVQQMMEYMEEYSRTSSSTFTEDTLSEVKHRFSVLNRNLQSVTSEESFKKFVEDSTSFLQFMIETCEAVWIEFDSFAMTRGLLFMFLSMFFVFIIIDGIPKDELVKILSSSYLIYCFVSVITVGILTYGLYCFNYTEQLLPSMFFSTGLISQIMLALLVIQNWDSISMNWYDRSQRDKIPNLICRLVLVFYLCGLFSNSFVVEESSVLLFLLVTVILVGTLAIINKDPKKKYNKAKWKFLFISLGTLVLLRYSTHFWRCRDRLEQPWCYKFENSFTSKLETTKLQWLMTVVSLGFFATVTKLWLKNCGNLNGFTLNVLLLKYVPTVLVVCVSGFWVFRRLPTMSSKMIWQTNSLVWIVYGASIFTIAFLVVKPLLIYVLPLESEIQKKSSDNVIPQLFQQVRDKINRNLNEVPVVCGLGTAFSAIYISIAIFLVFLFALLHGDAIAPSTVIMFVTSIFVLVIISLIRVEGTSSIEQLLEISNMSLLIWTFLAQYFFYGTGHQPSFPNIIWDAAFVGTSGIFQNVYIQATLIIINTFCSQILMGFLVPLLIITPFSISLMLPSIINKSAIAKDETRGELLLYESYDHMNVVIFTTIVKYMIFHALRVFATMLAATIHCRHMMIWKIFAPKLIFESVGLFVTLLVVNLSYLILIRTNFKVSHFIVSLNKQN